ncbi:GNAT family N-acetyltransferase [Streptomyces noursei]|uniref:GNAT family N-acetyltransferase n=1 Tax=Streptomyces noursei TaxID=1971 RepID=UPI003B8A79A5
MRFYLTIDPAGCRVAVQEAGGAGGAGEVVGFAVSQNRGRLWFLATYGVLPSHQGRGIGKRLMAAVLGHAGDRAGAFPSSTHPGATRRYRLAGFSLHPQMRMVGTVDRSTLPAVDGLREGGADDFAWMDRLDENLRIAGKNSGQLHHHPQRVGDRRRPRGPTGHRARGLSRRPRDARPGALPRQRALPLTRPCDAPPDSPAQAARLRCRRAGGTRPPGLVRLHRPAPAPGWNVLLSAHTMRRSNVITMMDHTG